MINRFLVFIVFVFLAADSSLHAIVAPSENFSEEIAYGNAFIHDLNPAVVICGSSRFSKTSLHYKRAQRIAYLFAQRGYSVITGGGGGIMEAANKGALQANGQSAGIVIGIKEICNDYILPDHVLRLSNSLLRKELFAVHAEAIIFLPGGFGSLDELFNIIALVQHNNEKEIPIILVGIEYWQPLLSWIENSMISFGLLTQAELRYIQLTDNPEKVLKIFEDWPLGGGALHRLPLGGP